MKAPIYPLIGLLLLEFSSGAARVGAGPASPAVAPPASRYLKVDIPPVIPVRIQRTWLYPSSAGEPDIRLEVANRSKRRILYLRFDLLEKVKGRAGEEFTYKAEFGSPSAAWGGRAGGTPALRPDRRLILSIPGKFMRDYYPRGPDFGSKAVLYFGYLVFAGGRGWEGHDDGSHWTARKCFFRK